MILIVQNNLGCRDYNSNQQPYEWHVNKYACVGNKKAISGNMKAQNSHNMSAGSNYRQL